MTVTLDLSGAAVRWLQDEATAKGTDPSSIAEEQFAFARARAEARSILNGPFHSLEESDKRFRKKYGTADLSHLSNEELAELINDGLAQTDPEKLAEARRQGLL